MATSMVARSVKSGPVDLALAREISDVEGIGLKAALVLAELYGDELLDYAQAWDSWATAQRAHCPQCGASIVERQYYVGGRGYVYVEVCSGDASHTEVR